MLIPPLVQVWHGNTCTACMHRITMQGIIDNHNVNSSTFWGSLSVKSLLHFHEIKGKTVCGVAHLATVAMPNILTTSYTHRYSGQIFSGIATAAIELHAESWRNKLVEERTVCMCAAWSRSAIPKCYYYTRVVILAVSHFVLFSGTNFGDLHQIHQQQQTL